MSESEPQPGEDQPDATTRLLALLRDLAVEARPDRADDLRVGLQSDLERDLGLDSLARSELLLRVEKEFSLTLPDELLANAETVRDLVTALGEAGSHAAAFDVEVAGKVEQLAGPAQAWPDHAATLTQVLDWHAEQHGERPHIILSDGHKDDPPLSYGELAQSAKTIAAGLRSRGLEPGGRVALMLPTCADFFPVFFGILYAGGVPVPIYPPVRPAQLADHLRRQAATLDNAGAVVLVTISEAIAVGALLRSLAPRLRDIVTAADLRRDSARVDAAAAIVVPAPDDIAFLQYTSGSTGSPKGVSLTHANLLANVRAMGQGLNVRTDDVFISWLPLYHDMGLIGAWFGSLYFAIPAVIMSPLTFLARPSSWLWAIHRHRGTITAAPNFAYELCTRRIGDDDIEGLDLSSMRMSANGAEPVSPGTLSSFSARFAPYGFDPMALCPVYGLAECSVGLAFPAMGQMARIDRISRSALATEGRAVPIADDHDNTDVQEIVACGRALPRHEMRVADDGGRELGERQEGRLQFRGPSATSGYFENPEATATLFDGDWLESGDRAYLDGGDLFLTGRVKDIIIRGGRNIYPQEVEATVGDIEDVRSGCVACFGVIDPTSGTERIVVMAETRLEADSALAALQREAELAAADVLGAAPDDLVLCPPQTVLKTSSGKIRRSASRDIYVEGRIGRKPLPIWQQLLRLGVTAAIPELRRQWRRLGDLIYAGWWWLVIALAVTIGYPLLLVLPGPKLRWRLFQGLARSIFALTRTRLTVGGLENWSTEPAVVVSNHTSYTDGLALAATLPGRLHFTTKGELARHPLAAPVLKKLGIRFLERFDADRGVQDAEALSEAARNERLLFFPEGTLTRMPVLLSFRMGAFQTSARAGVATIPVVLRGTRTLLRDGQWFPRRSEVSVEILAPRHAAGDDWASAVKLRDLVRDDILERCHEPDLSHVDAGQVLRGEF
jgi:1-acyl-sn-glycerol-3-phosphate acyltransferase